MRYAPDRYSMSYARILHVYITVSIDTLTCMLKTFITCSYKCHNICDTIVRKSEYSLMGNYSFVGCRTLRLYDTFVENIQSRTVYLFCPFKILLSNEQKNNFIFKRDSIIRGLYDYYGFGKK